MINKERIIYYEKMFDNANTVVNQLENALDSYEKIKSDLQELEKYYTSAEWKEDYDSDEKGLFPIDLKRGVLSQDGIDSLLEKHSHINNRLKNIM